MSGAKVYSPLHHFVGRTGHFQLWISLNKQQANEVALTDALHFYLMFSNPFPCT